MRWHVGAYCGSGPYRRVRELLETGARWIPWGYRVTPGQATALPAPGDVIELWEVDDTRSPSHAEYVASGVVDYINPADDYFAMTLEIENIAPRARESDVVWAVSQRRLLSQLEVDVRCEPVGSSREFASAIRHGATLR